MPSVLVADHDAYVRRAIASMLQEESARFRVVEASSSQALVDQCHANPPNLVLLDAQLPSLDVAQLVRCLRQDFPELRILLMAFYLEPDPIRQCLKAGAAGYLAKDRLPEELLRAIFTVLAGETFVSPCILQALRACPE